LIAMFLISFGGCYVDVATFTSLQNSIDDAILARAFSVIGTIIIGALLLGGAIAPVLISLIGTTAALSLPGCVALVGTAFAIPTLRRIDAPAPDLLSPLAPLPVRPEDESLPAFAPPQRRRAGPGAVLRVGLRLLRLVWRLLRFQVDLLRGEGEIAGEASLRRISRVAAGNLERRKGPLTVNPWL